MIVDLYCRFVVLALFGGGHASAYFADWSSLAEGEQPTCVAIPANMSLCNNIRYTKMRLPNLLEHDTIQEASQQAQYWVQLLKTGCSVDTQLFLCSLFAPVCLQRPIYPCRSLCQKVKDGCEATMNAYKYPWPPMLECDKFPLDNDMCITSQAEAHKEKEQVQKNAEKKSKDQKPKTAEKRCRANLCNQDPSYDNILDNYCQADFVVKMKFKTIRKRNLQGRKVNSVYKAPRADKDALRKLRKPKLKLQSSDECCAQWIRRQPQKTRFLVMGNSEDSSMESLVPTFIIPWSRNKEMKRARRMFKKMGDCTNHNNQKNPHQQRPKTRSGLGQYQRSSLEKRRRRDGGGGGNGSTNKRRRRHQKHKQNTERKNQQSF